MSYNQDYFMRQVEGITDLLSSVLSQGKSADVEETEHHVQTSSGERELLIDLRFLLTQQQVNEAENLLFQRMEDEPDMDYQSAASQFFDWLDRLSDDALDQCSYSREEIAEGRAAVAAFYKTPASTHPPTFRCELLEVPGADNVRDVGGCYPAQNGRTLRPRRFIRAGAMSGLTSDGVAAVRDLGVQCVIDLRSTAEVRNSPDTLAEDESITYVHIPMLDYIQSGMAEDTLPQFPASMAEMYTGLLDGSQDALLRVFQTFADPAYHTVLFHCTAGKDRTGISAMLLMGLAGVSRADILEDYSYSQHLIDFPHNPDLPDYLFASHPETMAEAMDHLEQHYGGIVPYLTHIGVDSAMQEAILTKLLDQL